MSPRPLLYAAAGAQVLNKVDLLPAEAAAELEAWFAEHCRAQAVIPVSALTGANTGAVLDWVLAQMPEGPSMYPKARVPRAGGRAGAGHARRAAGAATVQAAAERGAGSCVYALWPAVCATSQERLQRARTCCSRRRAQDYVAEAPERFFVSEIIRRHVFLLYRQELPYSVAVQVVDYKERRPPAKDFIDVSGGGGWGAGGGRWRLRAGLGEWAGGRGGLELLLLSGGCCLRAGLPPRLSRPDSVACPRSQPCCASPLLPAPP